MSNQHRGPGNRQATPADRTAGPLNGPFEPALPIPAVTPRDVAIVADAKTRPEPEKITPRDQEHCEALTGIAIRGWHYSAGEKFWVDKETAQRLVSEGRVSIV